MIIIGVLLSCATTKSSHPTITKEQAYEMSQIGDMMTAMDQEIDPYIVIITKENMHIITKQLAGIIERYGYNEKGYRLEGYKKGNLFYFDLTIKLKHSPRNHKATAVYDWKDPISLKDPKKRAIPNILWPTVPDDYLRYKNVAEQLKPEQFSEDKTISDIIKEVSKQIPIDTVVTSETIETIRNQIERIIEKAGYSKEEYSMRSFFCPADHIHYLAIVTPKTRHGLYSVDAQYFFKMIEPKIPIKQNTI